jgi:hypothetical protein
MLVYIPPSAMVPQITVGNAQLQFHDQVAQVVREPRPAPAELRHPEDGPVIPFDLRVRVHPGREPPERDAHALTMTVPPAWDHSFLAR